MWAHLQKRSTVLYAGILHIPVQYSVEKVLIWNWNSFMFFVESLFCWLVFPVQSLIKKVLICSIYLLNNKNLECGHTSKKKVEAAIRRVSTYSLTIVCWNKYCFESVSFLVESLFCWLFFCLQRLIKTILICSIYLLNNKNLECGHTSKKKVEAAIRRVSTYSLTIVCWNKYCFESVSFLVESLFCWLFFCLQRLIKTILICSIYLLNNKNLECGHSSNKKVYGAIRRVSTYSVSIFYWKVLVCDFFQLLVESLFC